MIGTIDIRRFANVGATLLVVAIMVVQFRSDWKRNIPQDFGSFYCGGQSFLNREDPYRVGPISQCEEQLTQFDRLPEQVAMPYGTPFVLPPYTFPLVGALAKLPPRAAFFLDLLSIAVATTAIAFCLMRFSSMPFALSLAAAHFAIAAPSESQGQLAPIAIAAIGIGALLLRSGRHVAAAIVLCCSLIQPQIGAVVILSVLFFSPKTRVPLGIALALVVGIDLGSAGIARSVEYVHALPIQAAAEIDYIYQYGLSHAVYALSGNERASLAIGTVSSVVCVLLSLGIVLRVRDSAVRTGAIAFVPAAFAVVAGTYVHIHQMVTAVLLSLSTRYSQRLAFPAALGFGLLTGAGRGLFFAPLSKNVFALLAIDYVSTFAVMSWMMKDALGWRRATLGSFGISAVFAGFYGLEHFGNARLPSVAPVIVNGPPLDPSTLSSVAWGKSIELFNAMQPALIGARADLYWLVFIVTYIGMGLILFSASRSLMMAGREHRNVPD